MSRMVFCKVLKKEAPGLETMTYPGEIGERIFNEVSDEGWKQWLERLTSIINENSLNTADPDSIKVIEQHMLGFLFDEGDLGKLPDGFTPQGGKK
jgi:Fe-S cluster biosynthesis and repair protein YggX